MAVARMICEACRRLKQPAVQATASGLYIVEKVDLLVAYLIAVPLARWLASWWPKVRSLLWCTCTDFLKSSMLSYGSIFQYR